MIKFTKMHGTGNDYIYVDNRKEIIKKPEKLAIEMSDRHYGIGSDGLILIMKSKKADFRMRMFNSDGSEAEMCGNGIRCFGKYVYDHGLTDNKKITVETLAGIKELNMTVRNKTVSRVKVNMGEPILRRDKIPMIGDAGIVVNEALQLVDGTHFKITSVSMGNPHVIIFVEDLDHFPVEKYGPMIENHDLFPQRTNIEFVQKIDRNRVKQRTWERGSGETLACGTGASAVTVASVLTEQTERKLSISLLGGDLDLEWDEGSNHVFLTGPAVEIFEGNWPA